jgi:uncharacterized protein
MYYKLHDSLSGHLIAVADKELIGKTLKFKNTEFFVNPRFYKDTYITKAKLIPLLRSASSANLVGTKAIEAAKEAKIISDEHVIQITKDVPHAQVFSIEV